MRFHHIPAICLLLFSVLYSHAAVSDTATVHFRQSHIIIDPSYKNNQQTLDSVFAGLSADSTGRRILRGVHVIGAASPEGSVRFNDYLSHKRAEAIFDRFRSRGLLTDSLARFSFLGRDWRGLQRSVEQDQNVPYRDEVLALLARINQDDNSEVAHPLAALKAVGGGAAYRYLYTNIFPSLRESQLIVEYDRVPSPLITGIPVAEPFRLYTTGIIYTPEIRAITTPRIRKPFYMALKTNMLYDAALLPNIGAEVYVGKNWSVTADWMYGWWDRDRTHYYWRAYGGTVGARRWFGSAAARKPLTGHHLGAFAGVVTYDFELGGRGYMGGRPHGTLWDRCNFISGIEYGYSLPVGKRLNIDFSAAIGYMCGKYLEYVPKDNFYVWQSTHKLRWFGPTKLEIALVWLIGRGNYNSQKGGSK